MANFMSDDRANAAVVCCVVSVEIKERRLQNCCRENNFIHQWVVVSIDRLWGHQPFTLINRFSYFVIFEIATEFGDPCQITHQIPTLNF